VLQIPEHKLRVVAPDVGGGFGSKIYHYAEEALVSFAAKRVRRPEGAAEAQQSRRFRRPVALRARGGGNSKPQRALSR
jgi:CO/xanthine dehydrogenase Mo-binding subunit